MEVHVESTAGSRSYTHGRSKESESEIKRFFKKEKAKIIKKIGKNDTEYE